MSGSQAATTTNIAVRGAHARTPRCGHTSLTKPECHCQACLAEQIAAHAPSLAAVAYADRVAA
jgi:uncharacterized protein (DUF983 family)